MRRSPVLLRWFASYIVILVIPMLLSVGIYFYTLIIITKNTVDLYAASLERTRTGIDGLAGTVFQTLDHLIINRDVQKLSFVRDKPGPEEHWAIIQLVKELNNYPLASPFLDDVFIVLNETGMVVSTIGYIDEALYYRLFYENKDLGFEEFRALIRGPHRRQDAYPVGDYFLFFRTTLEGNLSRNSITVVIAVKRSKFEKWFIRENGTVMYIEDGIRDLKYYAPDRMPGTEPYRTLSVQSEAVNWRYVCLISDNVQKGRARQIQLVTVAGLVVSSLLGLFMSFVLSKRNYDPVKKLMSYFHPPEKNEAPEENEFAWLEKRAGESLRENRDTRLAIRNYYARSAYPQETEQKLLNLVKAGGDNEAGALIRQVFAANAFPEDFSGRMRQLLAYDVAGTIIKGIDHEGDELLDELNIEEMPPDELPAFLEKIARSACEGNRQTIQNRNVKALCEKVKTYIGENYRNPDINISQTGYHFGISPFYLSGIFREETGQSLLEYINTLRIEEGKRLLEAGRNVTEIAEMTGFRGSGAFIRVFKKITGVTPGQYRKMS